MITHVCLGWTGKIYLYLQLIILLKIHMYYSMELFDVPGADD